MTANLSINQLQNDPGNVHCKLFDQGRSLQKDSLQIEKFFETT